MSIQKQAERFTAKANILMWSDENGDVQ